ncbi:unnamed protein product [Closterium sp. NIES-54]
MSQGSGDAAEKRNEPPPSKIEALDGSNYEEWSGRMRSAFKCYKLLKLATGEEKLPEEGNARDRWIEKIAVLYDLILQSVNNDMFQHIKDLVELDDSGPKAWKLLRDMIQPNTLPMVIVLEKELAALSMRPGDDVKPVLDKINDTYARMAAAGSNVSQMQQCTKIISVLDNSRTSAGATRVVLPTKLLRGMELQEAAEDERVGEAEVEGEALVEGEAEVTTMRGMGSLVAGGALEWRELAGSGAHSEGAQGKASPGMFLMVEDVKGSEGDVGSVGKVVMHPLTHWVIDSGCTSHMTPRADFLDEVKPPGNIKFVAAASGALLPVIGVGNAKVMGANEELVGLGNVLLVEDLSANLLSVRRLQKSKAKVTFGPTSCQAKLGKLLRGIWRRRAAASRTYGSFPLSLGTGNHQQRQRQQRRLKQLRKKRRLYHLMGPWMQSRRCISHSSHMVRCLLVWMQQLHGQRLHMGVLTVPYNPQQNGVAERFNRTLQEGARTLLGRAGLPNLFWVSALRQVALMKNRVLATVGDKQWVPYIMWYGSAPAVNMVRAYGCMMVFHVPKEKRGKLEASGRWGVHLGIAKDHKGWLVWDLTSQKLTVSRDVKFLESLYYKEWKQQQQQQQQKLPTTLLIIEADEVQRPSRQVEVTVSEEEISGVTEDGGEPEVE